MNMDKIWYAQPQFMDIYTIEFSQIAIDESIIKKFKENNLLICLVVYIVTVIFNYSC